SLAEAIAFNRANADTEMPFFGQEIFELAAALETGADTPQPIFGGLTYNQALAIGRNAGVNRIDAALAAFHVDAVVTPTGTTAGVADRSHRRRPVRVRSSVAGGHSRLSDRECPHGTGVRVAGRGQLHRNGVQRACAHPPGIRLRARADGADRAAVLPDDSA